MIIDTYFLSADKRHVLIRECAMHIRFPLCCHISGWCIRISITAYQSGWVRDHTYDTLMSTISAVKSVLVCAADCKTVGICSSGLVFTKRFKFSDTHKHARTHILKWGKSWANIWVGFMCYKRPKSTFSLAWIKKSYKI